LKVDDNLKKINKVGTKKIKHIILKKNDRKFWFLTITNNIREQFTLSCVLDVHNIQNMKTK